MVVSPCQSLKMLWSQMIRYSFLWLLHWLLFLKRPWFSCFPFFLHLILICLFTSLPDCGPRDWEIGGRHDQVQGVGCVPVWLLVTPPLYSDKIFLVASITVANSCNFTNNCWCYLDQRLPRLADWRGLPAAFTFHLKMVGWKVPPFQQLWYSAWQGRRSLLPTTLTLGNYFQMPMRPDAIYNAWKWVWLPSSTDFVFHFVCFSLS